jgi:hypothetical protein
MVCFRSSFQLPLSLTHGLTQEAQERQEQHGEHCPWEKRRRGVVFFLAGFAIPPCHRSLFSFSFLFSSIYKFCSAIFFLPKFLSNIFILWNVDHKFVFQNFVSKFYPFRILIFFFPMFSAMNVFFLF